MKEIQEEKKEKGTKNFKPVPKLEIDRFNLQVIDELGDELDPEDGLSDDYSSGGSPMP